MREGFPSVARGLRTWWEGRHVRCQPHSRDSPRTPSRDRLVTDSVLAPVRSSFRALAEGLLPEVRDLDEAGWRRAEEIVEGALVDRPASVRSQIRLFIRVANLLPIFRYGRPLGGLSLDRRTRFLQGLQNAPVLMLRRGVWGLRTLVFMGYYAQEPVREAIGYRARAQGWSARGLPSAPVDAPESGVGDE